MMEFCLMIFLCVVMWVFVVCPALLAFLFDVDEYKASVAGGLAISLGLIGITAIVLIIGLCINFIAGDPQPITSMINRMAL